MFTASRDKNQILPADYIPWLITRLIAIDNSHSTLDAYFLTETNTPSTLRYVTLRCACASSKGGAKITRRRAAEQFNAVVTGHEVEWLMLSTSIAQPRGFIGSNSSRLLR